MFRITAATVKIINDRLRNNYCTTSLDTNTMTSFKEVLVIIKTRTARTIEAQLTGYQVALTSNMNDTDIWNPQMQSICVA